MSRQILVFGKPVNGAWLLLGAMLLLIFAIGIGENRPGLNQAQEQVVCHDGCTTSDGLAATNSREDVFLVAEAARNSDQAAMLSLIAQGRVVEIPAGTKISWAIDAGDGLVEFELGSGAMIGEKLYTAAGLLKKSIF